MILGGLVDAALEASVVGSFSRIGPFVRRRALGWTPLDADRLDGRTVVVTGATSGIGYAAAVGMGAVGARLILLARDVQAGARAARTIRRTTGATVEVVQADLSDLDSVRTAGAFLAGRHVDVLVHNAGALHRDRRTSPQGIEETVATHVVGPLLLSQLCMPALLAAAPSRIIVVTSGGMYLESLNDRLQMPDDAYDGTVAYARAKRAQVSLVEECATRLARSGVAVFAVHPGWCDTPGLQRSLPRFHRVMRPLLRSADEGADTIVWLASAPLDRLQPGRLYLDRRPRTAHRLRRTARSDTPAARRRLLADVRHLATREQRIAEAS